MAKVSLNTIKNWFKTGLKPTQAQFWDTWDSFWHKDEKIPITAINDIENILMAKANAQALQNHINDLNVHNADNELPAFGAFKWILRGTNHAGETPIAGDIFQGVISQIGEPLVVSSTLKWNGIGALNNTNLANFSISNSSEWEQPTLRSATITVVNATSPSRGVCGAAETEIVYFMGFEDYIVDGSVLYEDEDLTILKAQGVYASGGRNGIVDENGVISGLGYCA